MATHISEPDPHEPKPQAFGVEMASVSSNPVAPLDDERANRASQREHELGLLQAIKTYPWSLFWGVLLSLALVMESYDMMLIGSFLAFPAFTMKFGLYAGPVYGYQIPVDYQVTFGFAAIGGCVIGGTLNGWATAKFGNRNVYRVAMVLMTAFTFILFFAPDLKTIVVGEVLCGIPWGIFATLVPTYLAEICPLAFRPYMNSYVSICFATGPFIAAGVVQGLVTRTDQWAYRIPFALQWIWPVPLFIAAHFAPESPWWLMRQGRLDEAEAAAQRFQARSVPTEWAKDHLALMIRTDAAERAADTNGSYRDCFRGTNLRRTEIASVVFGATILVGQTFAYTPTYFFTMAGIPTTDAFKLGLGSTAISFTGTIVSWFVMHRVGRRTMFLVGTACMTICLLTVGGLSLAAPATSATLYGQGALCLVWSFFFSVTVVPLGWTVPAEIAATRVRQQTFALARVGYYLLTMVSIALVMYMMNPTRWNWQGKSAFFWAGSCASSLIWAYFRMPESKGRTFEELDMLFEARLPARGFRTYEMGNRGAQSA
jgi:SP family general alpha glucoside:H+ symporter-like MFS transporter